MKKRLIGFLMVCAVLLLAACSKTETTTKEEVLAVNYKNNSSYTAIAEQLKKDHTLDLNGLNSEKFTITGYAQGYDFNEAWFGSIGQMANSGCEVVLASGSGDFAFKFGNVGGTTIKVGGVDSLSEDFKTYLSGDNYTFCSGSYASMIGPALATLLRGLEGNTLKDSKGVVASQELSHLVVTSVAEIEEVIANDSNGTYYYDAHVVSGLLNASYNDFAKVSKADLAGIKAVKAQYQSTAVADLSSKNYTIGVLRNDTTSDEAANYQAYLETIAKELGIKVLFSDSTGGEATAEKQQIETWASAGVKGIICMSSGSTYGQAETCEKKGMVMVQFASHSYGDDLADLQATKSFLGCVGPSRYSDAEVGYKMAKYYIEQGYTKFAIFGGSIMFGADTHAYRVAGMYCAMIENELGITNKDFNK